MTKKKSAYDYAEAKKHWEVCEKENPSEEDCIAAVSYNPFILGRLDPKYQTEKICVAAVRDCGFALKYVAQQTETICIYAVKDYHEALALVKDQTYEICFNSIIYHPLSLKYVKNQTPELCIYAIRRDPDAIKYVNIPYTFDMVRTAFKKKPSTIWFVIVKMIKNNRFSKRKNI